MAKYNIFPGSLHFLILQTYYFLEFTFNPQSGELQHVGRDTSTRLDPRVADLLDYFCQHSNEVISKDELLANVWNGVVVTDNSITWAISQLRKALGDLASQPKYIETLTKKGYQFLPDVTFEEEQKGFSNSAKIGHFYLSKLHKLTLGLGFTLVVIWLAYATGDKSVDKLNQLQNLTFLDGLEEDPEVSPDKALLLFRHKANKDSATFQLYVQPFKINQANNLEVSITNDEANYRFATWGPDANSVFAVKQHNHKAEYRCEVIRIALGDSNRQSVLFPCSSVGATSLVYRRKTATLFFTDKRNDNNYAVYEYDINTQKTTKLTDPVIDGLGDNFISLDLPQDNMLILRDSYWANTEFLSMSLKTKKTESLYFTPARYYKAHFGVANQSLWMNWGNDQLQDFDWQSKQSQQILASAYGWNYNVKPINSEQAILTVADSNDGDILTWQNNKLKQISTSSTEKLPAIDTAGRYLAYVSNRSGIPQIWIRDVTQDTDRQLSNYDSFKEFRNLVWSPEGDWLVAVHQNVIEAFNPAQNISTVIFSAPHGVFYPSFSLDGQRIFYTSIINDQWLSFQLPFKSKTETSTPLLDQPTWLVREFLPNQYLFSKPYKKGLYLFNGLTNVSIEHFADFPENDYWQLSEGKIYFRQSLPFKSLQSTPLDRFEPKQIFALPNLTSELFSISTNGHIAAFGSRDNKQSDIKIATILYK